MSGKVSSTYGADTVLIVRQQIDIDVFSHNNVKFSVTHPKPDLTTIGKYEA